MTAPKPNINVFFKQKTVHLMNGVWDPFQVPGPISNPILDIGGESFLSRKDIRLAQPALVVCNALECDMLGSVAVPPIQLLGLFIEGVQVWVINVALIIPLMSAVGQPSGGLVISMKECYPVKVDKQWRLLGVRVETPSSSEGRSFLLWVQGWYSRPWLLSDRNSE